MNSIALDPFALSLLLVLTLLVPVIGVWDYRRLLRQLGKGRPNARLVAYRWTIAVQWALTLGFGAWWLLAGGGLAPIRLLPQAAGLQWLVVGAGMVALALVLLQAITVLRSPEKLEQVRRQAGELRSIAPRSPAERRGFVLLSITAGVCEEILYRGLLIAVLAVALGLVPAIVLSTAIFGLGHAYQGWKGIGKTAAAGLVLALLAVGSGSLFIPIVLHALVDLTSGLMLGAASRPASPVATPDAAPALETTGNT
jgi:membrane protease YdiL (CAAX protease family)